MIIYNGKPVLEERAKKFLSKLLMDNEELIEKVYNNPDCIDGLFYAMDAFLPEREKAGVIEVYFTGRTYVDWGKEIEVSRSRARDIVNKALTRLRLYGLRYITNGLEGYRAKVASNEAEKKKAEKEKEQKLKAEEQAKNEAYLKNRPAFRDIPLAHLSKFDFCNILTCRATNCILRLDDKVTIASFENGNVYIRNCGEKTAENIAEAISAFRNIYEDESFCTKLRLAHESHRYSRLGKRED